MSESFSQCVDRLRPAAEAEMLLGIFAGRWDGYVRWIGKQYITEHKPLTAEVVLNAFQVHQPVGAFFVGPNGLTHLFAYDVDRQDGGAIAGELASFARADGIASYLEPSDGGRAHLWIVLADLLEPSTGRRVLAHYKDRLGDKDPHIELRPLQDRLSGASLGSSLRLPTMPHRRTGQRYAVCDPATGRPLGSDLLTMLDAIERVPASILIAVAERCPLAPAPVHPPHRTVSGGGWVQRFNTEHTVREVLAHFWGLTPRGRCVRCPVHGDRISSAWVTADDRWLRCFASGCPSGGKPMGPLDLAIYAKTGSLPDYSEWAE